MMNNMKKKLLFCKLCGKPRDYGLLKCKRCQIKLANKRQREQARKIKKKEKKENNPRRLKKLCDKLWREQVIAWYGDKCIICGSDKINVHHIISRANRATRWEIKNGVPLCALHHTFGTQSAHNHPLWFREIMIGMRGVEWEKDLIKKGNEIWDGDYKKVIENLSTAGA